MREGLVNCTAEICSLKSSGEVGLAVQCRRRHFYHSKITPIFPPSVYFRSGGVLLQRLLPADVAAPADGPPGLHRNTLLLRGGEDAELLRRSAGILEGKHFCVSSDCSVRPETLWEEVRPPEKTNPASLILQGFILKICF